MESKPDNRSIISERFKNFRKQAFLTQARLAKIINVSRQAISKIENRHVQLHKTTWARFRDLENVHAEARKITMPSHWS
jgi:DNA-binding XRE family transcriptional regulator